MAVNPARNLIAGPGTGTPVIGGAGFNPLAAGQRNYGLGQGTAPNVGATANMAGYHQRDVAAKLRRDALLKRIS